MAVPRLTTHLKNQPTLNWAKKGESNPLKPVSSQSYNPYNFFNEILEKLFHGFVETKL